MHPSQYASGVPAIPSRERKPRVPLAMSAASYSRILAVWRRTRCQLTSPVFLAWQDRSHPASTQSRVSGVTSRRGSAVGGPAVGGRPFGGGAGGGSGGAPHHLNIASNIR